MVATTGSSWVRLPHSSSVEGRLTCAREYLSAFESNFLCQESYWWMAHFVHAFNKMNDATIAAQTPDSRKDMVLDTMSGGTISSVLDLTDRFC